MHTRIPFHLLRHGQRVTVRDRFGELRVGTVNGLLIFRTHCVLNMGGRYGTPMVADSSNIVRVDGRAA